MITTGRSSLAGGGVTARSRSASRGVLLCAASSATRIFFDRASNLADLRLLTLWRQTMRLAQIIIFLVGALAAVGLLMESMVSYGADAL
jgi:hypothetical protein